jgi:hypothetical protein
MTDGGEQEVHSIGVTGTHSLRPSQRVRTIPLRIQWKLAQVSERRHGTGIACGAGVTAHVKRQIARMLGEFLREAGVLVAVLAPLEWLVTHGALTLNAIVAIVVVAVPCLLLGMVLGLER